MTRTVFSLVLGVALGGAVALADDPKPNPGQPGQPQPGQPQQPGQPGPAGDRGVGVGAPRTDLKSRCESALHEKDYLKDCKISCREEAGKLICEGSVPSKVHACAVFLTCMSQDGVNMCDVSRLRVDELGTMGESSGIKGGLGTDVQPGLDKGVHDRGIHDKGLDKGGLDKGGLDKGADKGDRGTDKTFGKGEYDKDRTFGKGEYDKDRTVPGTTPETDKTHATVPGALDKPMASSSRKLNLVAVIMNPDEQGTSTQPAGARAFHNDVIVIQPYQGAFNKGDIDKNKFENKDKDFHKDKKIENKDFNKDLNKDKPDTTKPGGVHKD